MQRGPVLRVTNEVETRAKALRGVSWEDRCSAARFAAANNAR